MKDLKTTKQIQNVSRIKNELLIYGGYKLSVNEQKTILFLIAQIDVFNQEDFNVQRISLSDLTEILDTQKSSRSINERIPLFISNLSRARYIIETDVKIGSNYAVGYQNWFDRVVPIKDEEGDKCYEFTFSQTLKQYLLKLKEYTYFSKEEIIGLKSSFSVRLFQFLKAKRGLQRKRKEMSVERLSIERIRFMFDLGDKYSDFRNLRKRVIDRAIDDINQVTSIDVTFKTIKKGNTVQWIEFTFSDSKEKIEEPNLEDNISKLTFSQLRAYKMLVTYNVDENISFSAVTRLKNSEIEGFEDWYFNEVIGMLEKRTKYKKSTNKGGLFVDWFVKKKYYNDGSMFSIIQENIVKRKKELRVNDKITWANRMTAKELTKAEFFDFYKNQNKPLEEFIGIASPSLHIDTDTIDNEGKEELLQRVKAGEDNGLSKEMIFNGLPQEQKEILLKEGYLDKK